MGLDVTHDCFHGAYSSFTRWRNLLAEAAGYTMSEVTDKDLADYRYKRIDGLNYDLPIERYMGKGWGKEIPAVAFRGPDPMLLLHLHSDCDGVIKRKHQLPLADRLEELLPKLEHIDGGGHIGNAADKTRQFIAGLRDAHAAHETVRFH